MIALLPCVNSIYGRLWRHAYPPVFATMLTGTLLSFPALGQVDVSDGGIGGEPQRTFSEQDLVAREARDVERLQGLLSAYYSERDKSAKNMPSANELARREAAQQDAQKLARITFSIDKVRLSGLEGSTALSQITERLSDTTLPESRRDIAPICAIKTYLFGTLVGSESRSLKPVGKNHFVAQIRLQPGKTTLRIQEGRWDIRLPQNASASDFLVTFYHPPGNDPELHIFSVDELLAEENVHIPAWLPEELKIQPRTG